MKKLVFLAASFAFALVSAAWTNAQPTIPNYSTSEVKKMIHEAHTPQQYQTLAQYFKAREQNYDEQAASEKAEWQRRSQNVSGPAAKYPRPVDSSKNRYEYFEYEAQQMSNQATHFESLLATVQP
jgi:hypothetical protein